MKVLITGAAGHVGSILRPQLETAHECTYLDIRPVAGAEDCTIIASITDAAAVRRALEGRDAAIQLVMANEQDEDANVSLSYDVHVKGMHILLEQAAEAGVPRIIYASSMSVYAKCGSVYHASEDDPPDCAHLYGLTKRLGEEVCWAATQLHPELSVIAFRMVMPKTKEQWAELRAGGELPAFGTGPKDLGRLYLSALALEDHRGFDAFQACSDLEKQYLDWAKADRMLGWRPEAE